MEEKLRKQKRGISLIVLVITIIVMIILAGAIILTLNNSGIIGRAEEAKNKSDIASVKELVAVVQLEWNLMSEEEQKQETNNTGKFSDYANKKLEEAGIKTGNENGAYIVTDEGTVNTIYKEKNMTYSIIIPEDFVYIDGTKDTGIVIQDKNGNEFVWVPVENFSDFVRTEWSDNKPVSGLNSAYIEPATNVCTDYEFGSGCRDGATVTLSEDNDLTGEYAEYAAMKTSVQKYKGFYIGRYETGTNVERTDKSNGTTDVVVKKGAYVYNYVGWGPTRISTTGDVIDYWDETTNQGKGAIELSRNMYSGNKAIVSTLCYGVQWDAVLRFLSTDVNVTDSSDWGNYKDYNSSVSSEKQVDGAGTLQKTGSSEYWKAKNIYDIAGNIYEITMEMSSSIIATRGGFYNLNKGGADGGASTRYGSFSNEASSSTGFRIALYLI